MNGVFCILLSKPFDKIDMTLGQGQWPRVTGRTWVNQCALLLEKSVHQGYRFGTFFLWVYPFTLNRSYPNAYTNWFVCCTVEIGHLSQSGGLKSVFLQTSNNICSVHQAFLNVTCTANKIPGAQMLQFANSIAIISMI